MSLTHGHHGDAQSSYYGHLGGRGGLHHGVLRRGVLRHGVLRHDALRRPSIDRAGRLP